MRRIFAIAIVSAVTACGAGSANKSSATPGGNSLELDIAGSWDDPAADYPREPERPGDLRAAVNPSAPTIAIVGATILTASGERIENGTILLEGGAIAKLGDNVAVPDGARVIDGKGRTVTPGIIDTHSHIGVYASPGVTAHADGNEAIAASTPYARAEYGYWPQDPAITRALAGGVTAAQVLPGSANLIGGRGMIVAMRPGRVVDEVKFPGAPATIKMACGENPKRVYGDKGGPQTRMGEYAVFRQLFQQAAEYRAKQSAYRRARQLWLDKQARARELESRPSSRGKKVKAEPAPEPPPRDFGLETLAGVLSGEVLVHIHCYKAPELREMVKIADEFGFRIRSFHHALEAYKVRKLLVDHDIAISTWADWWGFKMEAFDGIPENAALFEEAGGRPIIHSDSSIGIQRLNQDAAKAMYAGRAAGIDISEDRALRWVTANPAWALGIDDVTGTLEAGKRADVVVWSASPFSVYAKPDVVIVGGEIAYERSAGLTPTDFELGNSAIEDAPARPASEGGAR